jgi:hypothetical protein
LNIGRRQNGAILVLRAPGEIGLWKYLSVQPLMVGVKKAEELFHKAIELDAVMGPAPSER